jgi:plastocyanin
MFTSFKGILLTATVAVGGALLAVGCGGTTNAQSPAKPAVTLNYQIVAADDGDKGPDGATHDTFKLLNPQPVAVGQKVTLSFTNKDDAQHSFTAPDLGINVVVPGSKDENTPGTITYTFTASKAGKFRWYCAIPCDSDNDGWAMTADSNGTDQENFMAGYITVNAS